ncbi:MAG: LPS assembly protein LptD [Thermodesulfobacteriota bacterium]
MKGLYRISLVLILLAGLAGFFCTPAQVRAQGSLITVDAQGPVDVRADRVAYDERNAIYTAEGEVEIARGNTRLIADRVRLDAKTMIAEAEGRVRLITPEQVVTGKSMVVNLNSGTGKIYQGRVFLKANHFYLSGQEMEKTGKDTYRVKKGTFTTCDGADPAWKITGDDMQVTIEGYGTAKNTAFRVKDVPVLWSPYLMFPAKFKRQSGLLPPQLGNSKNNGFFFSLPYYQTLGEDMDATVTLNYMSKRGVDLGLEYRYNLDAGSKGMFMLDYMPHDGMGQSLYDQGDNAKVYKSRYWFRGMANQKFFNNTVDLKADIDLVSDQDYLREFTFGYTGYDATNKRLDEWFGRILDPNTSLVRTNRVNLSRFWSATSFNAGVLYYDDTTGNAKTTLQQMPYFSFDATTQQLGKTPLYFSMGSSFIYNYREEGSTGFTSDISPAVSMPLNFSDYVEVEPKFTWMQRFYSVSLDAGEDPTHKKTGSLEQWSFTNKTSTYLYRVYDFGSAADPFKVKHSLRPNIVYTYNPGADQSDIATLARNDLTRVNQFSYGFDNTLTYKIMAANPNTGTIEPTYREFLRLNVYHSFDLNQYRTSEDSRPWGQVTGRVEFLPNERIYMQGDVAWNPYDNQWTTLNFWAQTKNRRGDSLTVDYQYTQGTIKQLNTTLKVLLTKEWFVAFVNRHDFDFQTDYETRYEVGFEGQCWGFRAIYIDDVRDRGFFVAFSLGGFGELLSFGR